MLLPVLPLYFNRTVSKKVKSMAKRKRFYMLVLLERINSPDWAEVKIPAGTRKPLKKQDKLLMPTLPIFRLWADDSAGCPSRDRRSLSKTDRQRIVRCPTLFWSGKRRNGQSEAKNVMVGKKQNFFSM